MRDQKTIRGLIASGLKRFRAGRTSLDAQTLPLGLGPGIEPGPSEGEGSAGKRNFFIVGAQKAGTSALYNYLCDHPQLSLSRRKELHFFDNEDIDWSNPPYERLEEDMGRPSERICGEATPITMYWPKAIERLHAYDPNAKLIAILRHPTFRAHSHWRMNRKRDHDTVSFSEAVREGRRRVTETDQATLRRFDYVERGFYGKQLVRTLRNFDRSQLLVLTTDKFWLETDVTLREVEQFLGVDHRLAGDGRYVAPESMEADDALTVEDRRFLVDLYKSDICQTIELTGLDLSSWLDVDYEEPERA